MKRNIAKKLKRRNWENQPQPMFAGSNIHYDIDGRKKGIANGGIGVIQQLSGKIGLTKEIDDRLQLLKRHLPYHESDHVLNIAYNIIAGGHCLEDIELLRNDEGWLDALGAEIIPDPTTAGDFLRRFDEYTITELMEIKNTIRREIWRQQPKRFLKQADLNVDGAISPTAGECKQTYRMIVLKKHLHVKKGQQLLFDDIRYFFYITNNTKMSSKALIQFYRGRADHENDIEQLKNGVRALQAPSDTLVSNWAYMVIASLAWDLKAWYGMLLPYRHLGLQIMRMEFKRFVNTFVRIPCLIIKTGRRICYRLVGYNAQIKYILNFSQMLRAFSFG